MPTNTRLALLTAVGRIDMLFDAAIAAQRALTDALKEIEDGNIPGVNPDIALHYRARINNSVPEVRRLRQQIANFQTPVPAAASSTPRFEPPVEADSPPEARDRKRKMTGRNEATDGSEAVGQSESPPPPTVRSRSGVAPDSPATTSPPFLRRSNRVANQTRTVATVVSTPRPRPHAPASQRQPSSTTRTLADIGNTFNASVSSQIPAPVEEHQGQEAYNSFKFKLSNLTGPAAVPFGWTPQIQI